MPAIIDLQLWESKVYEFGITLPIPELPKPTASWGPIGLAFKLTCPGQIVCGNPDADKNCSWKYELPFKIPGFSVTLPFPPAIKIPPLKIRIVIPPKVILPIYCPMYTEQNAPPE
jgi:hypothetical protein